MRALRNASRVSSRLMCAGMTILETQGQRARRRMRRAGGRVAVALMLLGGIEKSSVNSTDSRFDLAERKDRSGDVIERDQAALGLVVSNEQLARRSRCCGRILAACSSPAKSQAQVSPAVLNGVSYDAQQPTFAFGWYSTPQRSLRSPSVLRPLWPQGGVSGSLTKPMRLKPALEASASVCAT